MGKAYHHGNLATELLKAAEEELERNGIEAFSLRAVAKRAGVSHSAPAHHFKDAKGLLTELAAVGYERFVLAQEARQKDAAPDPKAQSIASGLGYLDFAAKNPELFRLMFASEQPNRADDHFATASMTAFEKLLDEITDCDEADPRSDAAAMSQAIASWSLVHGLADLLISGRLDGPLALIDPSGANRDEVFSEVLSKAI